MNSRVLGVDLFAGAGGMSLGATLAGVDVALAVEVDKQAAATFAKNHPETQLLVQDVRAITIAHLPKKKSDTELTIAFGGPPCQGFSYSNQKTRSLDNSDNWLFLEFLRIVRIWKPDVVVFENVKGIVDTAGGAFLASVLNRLIDLGYVTTHGVLDASKFGVPQCRNRLFVIGARNAAHIPMPAPKAHVAITTVDEAIRDLPVLGNGASENWLGYGEREPSTYAKRMRKRYTKSPNHLVSRNAEHIVKRYLHIPQGGNWADIPARLMRNYTDRTRCHTGIYHRLSANLPSVVIGNYRKNMLIHPTQDRGLSVREAARIQSFPDWYEFVGSIGFQQQQVGNAVPPYLAEAVFRSVLLAVGILR